jgi:hypothetical protein
MKRKTEIEKEKPKSISCNKPFNIERHGLRGGAPGCVMKGARTHFRQKLQTSVYVNVGYFNVV